MTYLHAGHTAAYLNKKLYIFSGMDYVDISKKCEIFLIEDNKWDMLPEIPVPIFNGGSTVLNDNIYLIGKKDEESKMTK